MPWNKNDTVFYPTNSYTTENYLLVEHTTFYTERTFLNLSLSFSDLQ